MDRDQPAEIWVSWPGRSANTSQGVGGYLLPS